MEILSFVFYLVNFECGEYLAIGQSLVYVAALKRFYYFLV